MQIPQQQQSSSQPLSRSAPQTSPIHSHFQKREQQQQYENHHQYNAQNFHPVPNLNKKEDHQTTLFQSTPQSNHTHPPPPQQNTNNAQNNAATQNNASTQNATPTQIQNQLATQLLMEKKVQIQAPPPSSNGGIMQ